MVLSLVLLALTFPSWTSNKWVNQVLDVLPSLLSFSVAAYAILFTFGASSFGELLTETSRNASNRNCASREKLDSIFMEINAAFVFFIGLQLLSLVSALICDSWLPNSGELPLWLKIFSAVAYWLFLYGVLVIFPLATLIFKTAIALEYFHEAKGNSNTNNGSMTGDGRTNKERQASDSLDPIEITNAHHDNRRFS